MKTTFADRIAVVSVLAVALMTAGEWVRAWAIQRKCDALMRTTYAQPTPEFGPAVAASEEEDAYVARPAEGQ